MSDPKNPADLAGSGPIRHVIHGERAQALRFRNEEGVTEEFVVVLPGVHELALSEFNRMHVPIGHYEWQVTPWAREDVHDVSEFINFSFIALTACLVHLWSENSGE